MAGSTVWLGTAGATQVTVNCQMSNAKCQLLCQLRTVNSQMPIVNCQHLTVKGQQARGYLFRKGFMFYKDTGLDSHRAGKIASGLILCY